MNDSRLAELREKYKDRNLLEELAWGMYHNHSGYMSKTHGEFLNWLCNAAYRAIKEQPPMRKKGKWLPYKYAKPGYEYKFHVCSVCGCCDEYVSDVPRPNGTIGRVESVRNFCPTCGADMRKSQDA